MINKERVIDLVKEKLSDDMFLVEVSVSKTNNINVFVDGFNGITIEKCVEISRNIEHNLDREDEDFELQVSSPGLTENFKVFEQYLKYKLREVEIVTSEELSLSGVLIEVNKDELVLETKNREKVEGHKKKQLITKQHILKFNEIKSAKPVISFNK